MTSVEVLKKHAELIKFIWDKRPGQVMGLDVPTTLRRFLKNCERAGYIAWTDGTWITTRSGRVFAKMQLGKELR